MQYHLPMADTENDTTEVRYCSSETYRATRLQPAEYCENEVEDEDSDLCPSCQRYEDGPDPDDAYDAWRERDFDPFD